jgi:hypothetical protein
MAVSQRKFELGTSRTRDKAVDCPLLIDLWRHCVVAVFSRRALLSNICHRVVRDVKWWSMTLVSTRASHDPWNQSQKTSVEEMSRCSDARNEWVDCGWNIWRNKNDTWLHAMESSPRGSRHNGINFMRPYLLHGHVTSFVRLILCKW